MKINDSVKQLLQTRALQLVHEHGSHGAGERLGITGVSALRIAAGTRVRAGTLHLAATALGLIGAPAPLALSTLPSASDVG